MTERETVFFDQRGNPVKPDAPVFMRAPLVKYSTKEKTKAAEELQTALNLVPGIYLKVDGIAGPKTSDAVRKITGYYLQGDPRQAPG